MAQPWRTLLWLGALLATPSALLRAQGHADCWQRPPQVLNADTARRQAALGTRRLTAARVADAPPRIDGHLDDAAWCTAPAAIDFVQTGPNPGALATLPTIARVLYDDAAVYVALRAFDPHPGSIAAPYLRRDDENNSDWLFVEIDSRHDRKSGFSFGVNPRGVQVDGAWSDNVNYDGAWNGVWSAAARVDSLGWTAEFRIPFSQLSLERETPGESVTWGINFYRTTPYQGETSNWSPRLPSVVGVISHFNELTELIVQADGKDLEIVPYSSITGAGGSTTTQVGGDLHIHPSRSTTVALSVRPDFGQVEADPSLVNLTTFESYLPEQRPTFVNDAALFQPLSGLNYSSRGTSFADESPFYSRRIGAPPHGTCPASTSTWTSTGCQVPTITDVLAAARFTDRSANGWSSAVLQAWTQPERTRYDSGNSTEPLTMMQRSSLAEPTTAFTAARVVREFAGGRSALGGIATLVNRFSLSDGIDSLLAKDALVIGADGHARFAHDRFEVSGFAMASRVAGTSSAIATLRREPRHGYDRADSIGGPPTASDTDVSLSGVTAQAQLVRLDGRLQWGLASRLVSGGFEANDVGFQRNADWLLADGFWSYQVFRPDHAIRRWSVGSSQIGAGWTTAGVRRSMTANVNGGISMRNYWGGTASVTHEFSARDPEVLRGGPALLLPPEDHFAVTGHTDTRRRWLGTLTLSGSTTPTNGSHQWSVSPDFTAFVTDRLQVEITPAVSREVAGWQYAGQGADNDGQTHYVLGTLRASEVSLTARATFAVTPNFSLQLYAQPFLAGGAFTNYLEVVAPGAATPAARVMSLGGSADADPLTHRVIVHPAEASKSYEFGDPSFSDRTFHLNAVVRWEFRPGSTAFLVWTQQRQASGLTPFSLPTDWQALWRASASNAVQLKISYWIGH